MKAYLCVENLFETEYSSHTASDSGASSSDSLKSWDMSDMWRHTTSGNAWIRPVLTGSKVRDTAIVWGHNAINADDIVFWNENTPIEIGRINHPGDGSPVVCAMSEQATTSYGIYIESATNYAKGFRNIWIGNRIAIPGDYVDVGFDDARGGRDSSGNGRISRGGVFTSIYSTPSQQRTTIDLNYIDSTWYDTYWPGIADHIAAGKPFYFIPQMDESTNQVNSDVLLCWADSVPTPKWINGIHRRIKINVHCVRL